jgi:hypothetical protein
LEIDRTERPFGFLPLLETNYDYFADTVDLTQDEEARKYWLTCFEGMPKQSAILFSNKF